jgi:hypothetical protein
MPCTRGWSNQMPGGRSRGFPGEARPRVGRVARLQPRAPMSTGCPWSESAARRAGARVVRLRLFVRLSGWQARETNVVGAQSVSVSVSVIQVLDIAVWLRFLVLEPAYQGWSPCVFTLSFFQPCWILQFGASFCSSVVYGLSAVVLVWSGSRELVDQRWWQFDGALALTMWCGWQCLSSALGL